VVCLLKLYTNGTAQGWEAQKNINKRRKKVKIIYIDLVPNTSHGMDSAGFTEAEMDCLFGLYYGNL
jgi:hypothetical protein